MNDQTRTAQIIGGSCQVKVNVANGRMSFSIENPAETTGVLVFNSKAYCTINIDPYHIYLCDLSYVIRGCTFRPLASLAESIQAEEIARAANDGKLSAEQITAFRSIFQRYANLLTQ